MVTHAIKKLDSSKWQSIEKVSLLQFCETTIKVLTPSALFRITVMRKKSPLLWLFSFFLFLTYSLLCTLKTHYLLTFSAHKQIHMRIEIWFHKQDYRLQYEDVMKYQYTRIRSNFLEDISGSYMKHFLVYQTIQWSVEKRHTPTSNQILHSIVLHFTRTIVFLYTVKFTKNIHGLSLPTIFFRIKNLFNS